MEDKITKPCICWDTPSGQCCAVHFFLYSCGEPFFPTIFSLILFSCLHSELVKDTSVTDSFGEIARLFFIKHKYLLRVWVWSTFMKWWVTFPHCRLRPTPHCEKLLPQIRLLLHSATKGKQMCSAWEKLTSVHKSTFSTAFQNTKHSLQFNPSHLIKQAFKLFLTNGYEVWCEDLKNKSITDEMPHLHAIFLLNCTKCWHRHF